MTIPFVQRFYDFSDDVIWPAALKTKLDQLPIFKKWAENAIKQESVQYVTMPDLVERVRERLPKVKAKYAEK
jgi:hypothetical protein